MMTINDWRFAFERGRVAIYQHGTVKRLKLAVGNSFRARDEIGFWKADCVLPSGSPIFVSSDKIAELRILKG